MRASVHGVLISVRFPRSSLVRLGVVERARGVPRSARVNGRVFGTTLANALLASIFVIEAGSVPRSIGSEEGLRVAVRVGITLASLVTGVSGSVRRRISNKMAGIRHFVIRARRGMASRVGLVIARICSARSAKGLRCKAALCARTRTT